MTQDWMPTWSWLMILIPLGVVLIWWFRKYTREARKARTREATYQKLMDKKPKVATICGSTSQWDQIADLNRILTLQGKVVLAPGVSAHEGSITEHDKSQLDRLHLHKIDMAEEVHFIRKPDGTFGESTNREFDYATKHSKTIYIHWDLGSWVSDSGQKGANRPS